jgi:hypothetical protein
MLWLWPSCCFETQTQNWAIVAKQTRSFADLQSAQMMDRSIHWHSKPKRQHPISMVLSVTRKSHYSWTAIGVTPCIKRAYLSIGIAAHRVYKGLLHNQNIALGGACQDRRI